MNAPTLGRLLALPILAAVFVACSCAGIPTLEEALQGCDLAVATTVIGHLPPARHFAVIRGTREEILSSGDMVGWVTVPTQCWKGSVADTLIVYTPASDASCGVRFEIGTDYIIFGHLEGREAAWNKDRGWPVGTRFPAATTYLCTRTQSVRSAQGVVAELGEPIWQRGDPDY